MLARKKYMDLRPKIAMILELKTKNGSEVMAKIAGILSNAKRISVNSMITNTTNKGVNALICLLFTINFSPSKVEVIGIYFLIFLYTKEVLGLNSLSFVTNIFI